MMTNNFRYVGAVALVLGTALGAAGADAVVQAHRPNILIILSDDIGYTDTGCYGATRLKTPNIDRLAAEGMRFTDAHSPAAVCSPTRYGLLTGEYPFRNPHFDQGVLKFTSRLGIDVDQPTIASVARSQGYATGVVGKWHMGLGAQDCPDYNTAVQPGPLELGFDECYIAPGNLRDRLYVENHHVVGLDADDPLVYKPDPKRPKRKILKGSNKARVAKKPDITTCFTEKAVDFIDRKKDGPFLLYFAPHNVHVPIVTRSDFAGKSDCGPYGDYIMELDWMVGEVLAALDRNALADKTLVFFSSDNGGTYSKPHNAEAWKRGHLINGNLLGQKGGVWEAGHRVPLLVRWPGIVEPASTSDALVSLVDIMATLSNVWEKPLPKGAGPDGESFLPVLNGSAKTARDSTVYQGVQGLLALRQGDWVMIPAQGSQGTSLTGAHGTMTFKELGFVNSDYTPGGKLKPDAPPGQLYNLAEDLGQQHNLYRKHPARVARMKALLEEIKSRQE